MMPQDNLFPLNVWSLYLIIVFFFLLILKSPRLEFANEKKKVVLLNILVHNRGEGGIFHFSVLD